MDPSNAKDIIPTMADKNSHGEGQDESSDIIVRLLSSPHSHHQRDITAQTSDENENVVNWRHLSQPRHRRISARYGLAIDGSSSTTTSSTTTLSGDEEHASTSLHHVDGSGGYYEGSLSKSGSELGMHFAALGKAAVEASIQERIENVETELNMLRKEREDLLKELRDEMVDERWEEGILAIDDLIR